MTVKTETRVGSCKEFSSLEEKIVRPKKRRTKVKAIELATVRHQGKSLKMMGELASTWWPKTRPRNKLRLSMKKLLNPRFSFDTEFIFL